MAISISEALREKIARLPDRPGVYQFYDKSDQIIYVGKAKSLKKRVASYFNKSNTQNFKTSLLVKNIYSIQYVEVQTEADALLLENNMIKNYQPRYNVLLKDDKSFPWICIKNEPFPRIFHTRQVVKDGSDYFGPFTSVVMVKTLLDLVRAMYKIRTCNLDLSKENIDQGKFKVCLEYHLENCLGPCENLQSEKDYNEQIQQIKEIIKGNLSTVKEHLNKIMMEYAEKLKFEEAEKVKEKIGMLSRYQSKSTIVNPKISNVEVYAYTEDEKSAFINFLKVHKGAIVQSHNMEIVKKMVEDKKDILAYTIAEMRNRLQQTSREILLPFEIDFMDGAIKYTIPKRGDKLHLLELAKRNAFNFRNERNKQKEAYFKNSRDTIILEGIRKDLRLTELPKRIECFDNSNIQGNNPVAACVVFKNARPAKKEYRHYHIKSVKGPDDFASMREVVFRRYKRRLAEKEELPDLVVIDGGKGQLNAAMDSLSQLGLSAGIPIIGIAKKLEEIYFPGDSVPLYIDKNSSTLKVIQQIRNEAHRFGITFHRQTRDRKMVASELDGIRGIGEKSKSLLLDHFGTVDAIKKASGKELAGLIGKAKAEILIKQWGLKD
ncbi:MAG: excinuclease ABC subunit C [Bacteroidetes bacterium]|jgi:excinuclease ABC subunit C|nr:excinuclease ABC subunit C [Bacteroidota bacterium]